MCSALGVRTFSPLANRDFIQTALALNSPMSVIPKQKLREVRNDLPESIKTNYVKKGFPIPLDKWHRLSELMREAWYRFWKEFSSSPEPYPGINRYSWGVLQAEMFLRRNR